MLFRRLSTGKDKRAAFATVRPATHTSPGLNPLPRRYSPFPPLTRGNGFDGGVRTVTVSFFVTSSLPGADSFSVKVVVSPGVTDKLPLGPTDSLPRWVATSPGSAFRVVHDNVAVSPALISVGSQVKASIVGTGSAETRMSVNTVPLHRTLNRASSFSRWSICE